MDPETTADRIVRDHIDDPDGAAEATARSIAQNFTAEMRRNATTGTPYTGGTSTEEAIALMYKIVGEHGYPWIRAQARAERLLFGAIPVRVDVRCPEGIIVLVQPTQDDDR